MGREHHDLCFVCNRKIGKDAFDFWICWLILSAISIFKQQQCHKQAVLLICITVWNCKFWVLQVVPRTNKDEQGIKNQFLRLQNFFAWTGLFENIDDCIGIVLHLKYITGFIIHFALVCNIRKDGVNSNSDMPFYLRNLVKQTIHFVFIKIYIENKICCCCNHKIMKLPLTINLGLL